MTAHYPAQRSTRFWRFSSYFELPLTWLTPVCIGTFATGTMVSSLAGEYRPPRVDFRVPVDLMCSKGIRLSGKTRNLSTGGVFVETALLLPVGSPVRCAMSVAERPLELFGRVAWSRPSGTTVPGMGIQFVGFEHSARSVLSQVVSTGDPVPISVDTTNTDRIVWSGQRRLVKLAVFAAIATVSGAGTLALLDSSRNIAPRPAAVPGPTTEPSQTEVATEQTADESDGLWPETVEDWQRPRPLGSTAAPLTYDSPIEDLLSVSSEADGQVIVRIVLRDSVHDMPRHYPLADPNGIAIKLLDAQVLAPSGVQRYGTGPVARIWVNGPGDELRIFTRGAVPRYHIEPARRALVLTIDPH